MLEYIVGLHLYTQHFNSNAGYNNVNPGVYVSVQTEHICNPSAGYYYNSIRKDSIWVGCTFQAGNQNQYRLVVGAVTGYYSKLTPIVIPQYAVKLNNEYTVGIGIIPPVKIADGGGLHFTLEHKF